MKTTISPITTPNKFENIISYQEFFLIKDNRVFKIFIGKNNNQLLIKSNNYIIVLNEEDISLLIGKELKSIDEAYKFMINIFEENNIAIKKIENNKEINLELIHNGKRIYISLSYSFSDNEDLIFNELKQLKNDLNDLKNENKILKNELESKLKALNKNKNQENNTPKNIRLLMDMVNDSYAISNTDNSFSVFKSINDIFYLIYSNKIKSLICYDIYKEKKIFDLINYHNEYISSFRHILDKKNKRDLIMSISGKDNNVKILNFNNRECIVDSRNINKYGMLYSACFLTDKKETYFISSNRNKNGPIESIKIFNLKGEKINELKNSNENTLFIDTYYDNLTSKNFIITGNIGYVKSYDYNNNKIYHIYDDKGGNSNFGHFSIVINSHKEKIELIESCFDGNLRIWNFHSGLLLKKIKISEKGLRAICLWNDNYVYVGCDDSTIKLVETKNGCVVNNIEGHNEQVITIKKIILKNYGECLISQNTRESSIKLWLNKDE